MSVRKMKDSGIEWIGEIPEEWKVRKLFHLLNTIGGGTTPKDKTLLEDEGDIPWLNTGDLNDSYIYDIKNNIKKEALDEYSALKVFEAEAIVIAMYGATIGKLGIATDKFTTNQACCVLVVGEELEHKFLFYSLIAMRENIIALALGGGQPNISQDIVKSLRIPRPPLAEQKAIAVYLDEECTAIDQIVSSKQKQNEQLAEYRQSLITEAVTKGLNPAAPMKDSGIEWIGETPKEWQVRKLFNLLEIIGGGTTPKDKTLLEDEGDIPWLNTGDLNDSYIYDIKNNIKKEALDEYSALKVFEAEAIVIAMYGATIGKLGIATDKFTTNQACCVLVVGKELEHKFLFYSLMAMRENIIALALGGGQPNISQDIVKSLRVPRPPLAEQKAIAAYLDKKCGEIDALRENNKNIIESLQEYKQSLIYEAVTGKIEL